MGFFKTLLFLIIFFAVLGAAGFYGLPLFSDRYIAPLSRETQDLSDRIAALETFVQTEKETRANATLPEGADIPAIVAQVNAVTAEIRSASGKLAEEEAARLEFEQRLQKQLDEMVAESSTLVKKELDSLSSGLEKEKGTVVELVASVQRGVTILRSAQTLSNVMGHLVKAKSDLRSRNAGKALGEIGVVEKRLEGIAKDVTEGEEASVLQSALQATRNIRQDIEDGNPAVMDRIDLLWNDLERLALLFLKEPPGAADQQPTPEPAEE